MTCRAYLEQKCLLMDCQSCCLVTLLPIPASWLHFCHGCLAVITCPATTSSKLTAPLPSVALAALASLCCTCCFMLLAASHLLHCKCCLPLSVLCLLPCCPTVVCCTCCFTLRLLRCTICVMPAVSCLLCHACCVVLAT